MKVRFRGIARLRASLTLLASLVSLCLLAVPAGAVVVTPTNFPLPGSTFQGGDGNQDNPTAPADANNPAPFPANRDWQAVAGSLGLISVSDPNALDSTFGTGSHENRPVDWDILEDPDGVTPAKSNFFASYSFIDESGRFLYLGFDRQESGGNVFLAFELNQDRRAWTNASGDAIQCRTDGDLIVSYEIQNDDNIDAVIQQWDSLTSVSAAEAASAQAASDTFFNGEGCAKTGTFVDFNPDGDPDPVPGVQNIQAAINRGTTITNYLPRNPPTATFGEELFGEAAVNIGSIFEDVLGKPCFSFGQISLHGRSSESPSASLQDLVGPVPLVVRNCTISGTKWHDIDGDGVRDAGEPTIAGYRVQIDGPDAGSEPDSSVLTDANGVYTVEDLPAGAYTITEALDAQQAPDLQGFTCSFPTPCSHSTTLDDENQNRSGLDFGNYRAPKLTVEKQTVPDGAAGSFAFSSTIPGNASFSLSDGGSVGPVSVAPGTYTATESVPAGWELTGISCTGDDDSSGSGNVATFRVVSGENVKCTFTNLKLGRIEIEKQTDPDETGGASFGFTASQSLVDASDLAGAGFTLADDGVQAIADVTPNAGGTAYTVSEDAKSGYRLTGIDCGADGDTTADTATRTASIHVSPGETVHCTFTNLKLNPSQLVVKEGTLQAHHGDEVTYTFAVTNTGNTPLQNVHVSDDRCSPVSDEPTQKLNDDGDQWLETIGADGQTAEVWIFSCTTTVDADHAAGEEDPIHNTATATADDENGDAIPPATDDHLTDILHPDIEVDKKLRLKGVGQLVEGPIPVYVGDTIEYRFEVTNPGDTPLSHVTLSDPKCDAGTLSGPTKSGGNGDDALDPGETWTWLCTHVVTAADGDPIHNVVTVSGEDPLGGPASDSDEEDADVLHPAIDIEKTGPATAEAGTRVPYNLTVTNPGDVAIVGETLAITDPLCDSPPVLVGKARGNGPDPTPATLDPGDAWLYACFVPTTVGQTSILNVGRADGKDVNGRPVADSDEFPTALTQPAVQVLPEVVVSGAARLAGPARCVSKAFTARVTGRRISRVVWSVDGRRVKTFRSSTGEARQAKLRINPRRYGRGVHRLTARITFNSASRTRARTLRLTFQECARQVVRPNFTG